MAWYAILPGGAAQGTMQVTAMVAVCRAVTVTACGCEHGISRRMPVLTSKILGDLGALDFPAAILTVHPQLSADLDLGPDLKWGLGLLLNQTQQPGMRAAGSGGWAGLFNTYFWVDPASRVTGSIFAQTLLFAEPAALQLYADFEHALYAAL